MSRGRAAFTPTWDAFLVADCTLNFPGHAEEGDALLRQSFGASYERLQAVKAKYDPQNVFRSNFNIVPADR